MVKQIPTVEKITVSVTFAFSKSGTASTFENLWIGQNEVALRGRSLSECLAEMQQQGWQLRSSRAIAGFDGILCEYDFQRAPTEPPKVETAKKSARRRRRSDLNAGANHPHPYTSVPNPASDPRQREDPLS